MEDNLSLDNDFTIEQQTGKRPTFLLVICILTFVGTGISMLMNLYYGASYSLQVKSFTMVNELQSNMGQNDKVFQSMFGNLQGMIKAIYWNSLLNWFKLIVHVPLLIGAILMFRMKKKGFYMYLVCSIAILIINAVICFLVSGIGVLSISFMVYPIMGIMSTIAFIVMYSVNVKHLK